MTAVETRFAASVLLAGGLGRYPDDWPPATIPLHYNLACLNAVQGRRDAALDYLKQAVDAS